MPTDACNPTVSSILTFRYPATIAEAHPDGYTLDWDDDDESKRRRPVSGVRAMRKHVPAPTASARRKTRRERDAANAETTPTAITAPRASPARRGQMKLDASEAVDTVEADVPAAEDRNATPEPSAVFGDSAELSDYELNRLKLIQDNERMMQSLGLASSSAFMGGGSGGVRQASGIGARPIKSGPVVKRKRRVEEPTRRSSRQRNEAADDVYVTSDSSRTITVGGSGKDALIKLGAAAAAENVVSWGREDRARTPCSAT